MTDVGVLLAVAMVRSWPHALAHSDEALTVTITSGQWWWDIDTVEVPLGKPINFSATTEDVTHGLGIYTSDLRLLTQVQVIPGYTTEVTYTFDQLGTYQVLCMEYCGVAHQDMVNEFEVVALEE